MVKERSCCNIGIIGIGVVIIVPHSVAFFPYIEIGKTTVFLNACTNLPVFKIVGIYTFQPQISFQKIDNGHNRKYCDNNFYKSRSHQTGKIRREKTENRNRIPNTETGNTDKEYTL